ANAQPHRPGDEPATSRSSLLRRQARSRSRCPRHPDQTSHTPARPRHDQASADAPSPAPTPQTHSRPPARADDSHAQHASRTADRPRRTSPQPASTTRSRGCASPDHHAHNTPTPDPHTTPPPPTTSNHNSNGAGIPANSPVSPTDPATSAGPLNTPPAYQILHTSARPRGRKTSTKPGQIGP